MRFPATMKWIGLALLGLVIASAVAFAASGLVSRQIGIGSESISAGDALAPAKGDSEMGAAGRSGRGEETTPPTVNEGSTGAPTAPTPQPPNTAPAEAGPGDDHGSEGADD